jgi:hypothetical protein
MKYLTNNTEPINRIAIIVTVVGLALFFFGGSLNPLIAAILISVVSPIS